MKNTFLPVIAALLFSATASAQIDSTQNHSDTAKYKSTTTNTTGTALVTLDSNLPDHLKGVTSATVLPKHYLPVLGTYVTADNAVTLNLVVDTANMGIVWIEGLPQGRVKGLLKKAPATYKIPAQKTAEGKSVGEGALIYDTDAKQLWLITGATYNEKDPMASFKGKTKAKVWQLNRVEEQAPAMQAIDQ